MCEELRRSRMTGRRALLNDLFTGNKVAGQLGRFLTDCCKRHGEGHVTKLSQHNH